MKILKVTLGQCLAEMIAVQQFNHQENHSIDVTNYYIKEVENFWGFVIYV